MSTPNEPPRRQRAVWAAVVAFAVVLAGGVGWPAATVLRPADDPTQATPFTFVSVAPGEVGSSITLNTVAQWEPTPVGVNEAAGVVTGVSVAPGDEVVAGTQLYSVDLRPVVVAQGEVPAFRAIGSDIQGEDVRQLQSMLSELGYFDGDIDGQARWSTTQAIMAWQKALGVGQSGTVELGDVIFVPALPTRISLDTEVIHRGAALAGGEEVVRALPPSPVFTLPVTGAQAAMIPTGTEVQIEAVGGDVWQAIAADQVVDAESQTVTVALTGPDGAAICGQECGQIPVTGQARLASTIVTVPTVQGLVVPSAALVSDASGQVAVIDETGSRIPVTVMTAARGMSVIEGVADGVRVRVPAEAE